MVADPNSMKWEVENFTPRVGHRIKKGKRAVEIRFPESLFQQILAEATQREWSFSHMVRFLCEASVNGIE